MKIELAKLGRGFVPASEDAEAVHRRMVPGEIAWAKILRVRDPVAHRRYWALMELCAQNCERIRFPQGCTMLIHSKDDVHTAVKLLTGLCDTIFDADGKPAFLIPRSIAYEEMTADEWAEWWPKVTQAVCEHILPGVSLPDVQLELLKCMRLAA